MFDNKNLNSKADMASGSKPPSTDISGGDALLQDAPSMAKNSEGMPVGDVDSIISGSNVKQEGPKKKTMPIIIIVLILLVGGGIAFGGYYVFQQFTKSNPETIVMKSMENLYDAKSAKFSLVSNSEINTEMLKNNKSLSSINSFIPLDAGQEDSDGSTIRSTISVNGVYEKLDNNGYNYDINISFGIADDSVESGGKNMEVDANIKSLDEMIYFSLTQFQGVLDESMSGNFVNRWIEIDKNMSPGAALSLNGMESVDTGSIEDDTKKKDMEDRIQEIKELLYKYPPINITKEYGMDNINGEDNYHFDFEMDKENIILSRKEVMELGSENKEDWSDRELNMYNDYLEQTEKQSRESLARFDLYGQIWIQKENVLPTKIIVIVETLEYDEPFEFEINLSEFNKPVEIEKPQESESFETIFGEVMTAIMFSQMGGEAGFPVMPAGDTSGLMDPSTDPLFPGVNNEVDDADSDGLSDSLEEYYGTDKNNPDSDGDGYLDGDEVEGGYNPLGEGKIDKILNF